MDDVRARAVTNFISQCVALYQATGVPNSQNLKTGVQFSSTQSTTANDSSCASNFVAPRLTFQVSRGYLRMIWCLGANSKRPVQAHMAPLDIAFTADGNTALIPFHGSCESFGVCPGC